MKIHFRETAGIERHLEPVSFGVPFAPAAVFDTAGFRLADDSGAPVAHDARVLGTWPDKSLKWVLVDTMVSVPAHQTSWLALETGDPASPRSSPPKAPMAPPCGITVHGGDITVDTGAAVFCMGREGEPGLFKWIQFPGHARQFFREGAFFLTDDAGSVLHPVADAWQVAHDTALKKEICFSGRFLTGDSPPRVVQGLQFICRLRFYAGKTHVKISFTPENSKPAMHYGGAWDLGDPNTIYFKDLSFSIRPETDQRGRACLWTAQGETALWDKGAIGVYQDSSGGENWQSKNHVNHQGRVPLRFRGFIVTRNNEAEGEGGRANPVVGSETPGLAVCCYLEHFWQNFPKAMDVSKNRLSVRLFPGQFADLHALQPGERKTHSFYLMADPLPFGSRNPLEWAREPLVPVLPAETYATAMVRPRPVPAGHGRYDGYVGAVVGGDASFSAKNEGVDEFGWRHFGDVHADHEAVNAPEAETFISHYNNQYDVVKGLIVQFMRTGNPEWFHLAKSMAEHVADIDIYHTEHDKPQFNRGMFWHTDHHLDAATSGHRTISEAHRDLKPPGGFGGGPAPDHNYATGFLYLYWMTGEAVFKEAVLDLASNIVNCMDAPHTLGEYAFLTLKRCLKSIRAHLGKGQGSYEDIYRFEGPGRVTGNGLNTLLDAWLLTGDASYLKNADRLIAGCVSLEDDFRQMDLLNAEKRWMYTIFLQALGRYLDLKNSISLFDGGFAFARAILVRYARWMADNETPFLDRAGELDFPTETWAAQDIRKADIFAVASDYAPPGLRACFVEKSRYFFDHCLTQLAAFDTRFFTRPLAILLTNAMPSLELISAPDSSGGTSIPGRANAEPAPPDERVPRVIFRLIRTVSLKREINWIRIQIRSKLKK